MAKNEAIRIKVSAIETVKNVMGNKAYEFIGYAITSLCKNTGVSPFKKNTYEWAMFKILREGVETEADNGETYKAPKPIDKLDLEGNLLAHYNTTREMLAAEGLEYGEESKQIWYCLNGYIDSALGFKWKYSEKTMNK